jgi:ferritin-like metal-binding protein YciE
MMANKLTTLQDLLVDELQDLYDAEHQITKALPKMAKAATSRQLTTAFNQHLTQTEGHIARLEQAFSALGQAPKRKPCKAMKGLLAEGDETMEEDMEKAVKDAALIGAAQRVEHYEIAAYGTVCTFAHMVGKNNVESLLRQTLDEEKQTDEKLTQIAVSSVNEKAT